MLLVTLLWGATFPVLKRATAQLSAVEISALRFSIAALCMAPWALRARRAAWRDGMFLGVLVLLSYVLQAEGLVWISSNRSAFLTSLNVLMVPLLGAFWGRRPSAQVLLAAALALLGIGLMSWDGEAHLRADIATVLGALAFALYVLLLSQRAARHGALELAATQMASMALCGLIWMLFDGSSQRPLSTWVVRLSGDVLAGLLYLGVIASAVALLVQTWAQRHVAAEQAAVIYAMEPVFATLFGWIWLHEGLTQRATWGALVVVLALVLSEWRWAAPAARRAPDRQT